MGDVNVVFEAPPGNPVTTRQFVLFSPLRITGKATSALGGVYQSFAPFTLDITSNKNEFSPITINGSTDWLGNFAVDIITPSVVSKATLRVIIPQVIGPATIFTEPIAFGTQPDPLPNPPLSTLDQVLKWAPWILLALAIIYGASQLPKGRK